VLTDPFLSEIRAQRLCDERWLDCLTLLSGGTAGGDTTDCHEPEDRTTPQDAPAAVHFASPDEHGRVASARTTRTHELRCALTLVRAPNRRASDRRARLVQKRYFRAIPHPLKNAFHAVRVRSRVRREFSADRDRYAQSMLLGDYIEDHQLKGRRLEAQILKDYHRIEKGLALPQPRRPFGKEVAERLHRLLQRQPDGPVADDARSALAALARWNETGEIDDAVSPIRAVADRGIAEPERFFESRHSVRNFRADPVDDQVIERALALAAHTPSVCNRSPWSVRFYREAAERRQLLSLQTGNSGFGESAPLLALVSADLRMFSGPGERNQAWIDGGLFAMSLVYAFHALGVDTCMLNLSITNERADRIRSLASFDPSEVPVVMIAVGYGSEQHRRARSPRRPVAEIWRR
jgi:nitroreductase